RLHFGEDAVELGELPAQVALGVADGLGDVVDNQAHESPRPGRPVPEIRRPVCGSNSTALFMAKANGATSPGRTSASACMRAMTSTPASRVTTKVSEPAGSTTSTRQSARAMVPPGSKPLAPVM